MRRHFFYKRSGRRRPSAMAIHNSLSAPHQPRFCRLPDLDRMQVYSDCRHASADRVMRPPAPNRPQLRRDVECVDLSKSHQQTHVDLPDCQVSEPPFSQRLHSESTDNFEFDVPRFQVRSLLVQQHPRHPKEEE